MNDEDLLEWVSFDKLNERPGLTRADWERFQALRLENKDIALGEDELRAISGAIMTKIVYGDALSVREKLWLLRLLSPVYEFGREPKESSKGDSAKNKNVVLAVHVQSLMDYSGKTKEEAIEAVAEIESAVKQAPSDAVMVIVEPSFVADDGDRSSVENAYTNTIRKRARPNGMGGGVEELREIGKGWLGGRKPLPARG